MSKDNKKTLPKNHDSDYSLPGRFEESNLENFEIEYVKPKPKSRRILIIVMSFLVFSSVFFTYNIMKQSDDDLQLIQNILVPSPEQKLVNHYGVGKYGSDHDHAAIVIFVNGDILNFSLSQFQMSSKYVHFENHNSHILHKHATGVPFEMLFSSLGIKITQDCMLLDFFESLDIKTDKFCTGEEKSLSFYVNGKQYHSDLSQYVFEQNDRILVSFGNPDEISEQLDYLKSLKIFDVPKKTPQYSGDGITI